MGRRFSRLGSLGTQLGLMLFVAPEQALAAFRRALRPGGRASVVVFSTPAANPFMSKPMQILLRHAGKAPPAPGQPGVFSLGAPGALERLFADAAFVDFEEHNVALELKLPSATQALDLMQEAFGAYRAVISSSPETVQRAAWAEVGEALHGFKSEVGFVAPGEARVAAAVNPASR